jgi:hypothetical protein
VIPTVAELLERYRWALLRGCPGRYVLRGAPPDLVPAALVGDEVAVQSHRVPGAGDEVLVARLLDGGLISYRRADGTHVHTLNTPEGLARKLAQLGIPLPSLPG